MVKQVRLSPKAEAAVRALHRQLSTYTTLNMVHLDSYAKTPRGKKSVGEVMRYAIQNSRELLKIDPRNREQLLRNTPELLNWSYKFLEYADPRLRPHLAPKDGLNRFDQVKEAYRVAAEAVEQDSR